MNLRRFYSDVAVLLVALWAIAAHAAPRALGRFTAPERLHPIAHATGTGKITGQVTDSAGRPLGGMVMLAFDGSDFYVVPDNTTDGNGNFTFSNLPAGSYFVDAFDTNGNRYVDTWYPNVWDTDFWRNLVQATPVRVADGQTVSVNISLPLGAHVLLTLKDAAGNPIDVPGDHGCWGSMFVEFNGGRYRVNGDCILGFDFNNGSYEPYVVPIGRTYFIEGWPRGTNFAAVFYDQKPSLETATPFTLSGVGPTPVTIVLGATGSTISGHYTFKTPQDQIVSAAAGLFASDGTALKTETPAADGSYTIGGLSDGDYVVRLQINAQKGSTRTTYTKYYANASTFDAATRVKVRGANVTGIDVVMDTAADSAPLKTNTARIDLIVPAGGSAGAPLSFWTDSGTSSWTASAAASWVRFSASSGAVTAGQGAQTITVSADASALQPGSYSDTITISGSAGAPLQIPVSLQVTRQATASDTPLKISPGSLSFSGEVNQFPAATVTLMNPGAAAVSWNLRSSVAQAFPSSGSLDGGASVDVKVASAVIGLEFGSVSGSLDLLTNGRVTSSIAVVVNVAPVPTPITRSGAGARRSVADTLVTQVVPAIAANLPGAQGSLWSADVFLATLPSNLATNLASFIYTPFGSANGLNSLLVRGPVKLPMTTLATPLTSMFRINSGFGAMEIRPDAALAAWSRVWTPSADGRGTYGQEIPAFDSDSLLRQGDTGIIPVILGGGFRSNLTLTEVSGAALSAHLVTRDGSGAVVDTRDVPMSAYEQKSLGGLLPAGASVGYVELAVTGGGGLGALASLVDNATNDPTTVMVTKRAQRTASGKVIVPGVAHAPGANNTTWRSDVWLVNSSTTLVAFTSVLYPRGGGAAIAGRTYSVPAHAQVTLGDAVMTDFNMANGTGMLMLDVSSGDATGLRIFSRTFNMNSAGGTFGQGVQAVSSNSEVRANDAGLVLFGLQRNRNFRTNLQIQETSGASVTVQISGSATTAGALSTTLVTPYFNVPLGPYEYTQIGDVLSVLALPDDATNARVTLKVTDGSGSITAYGSMIDSATGDATTVPAYRLIP